MNIKRLKEYLSSRPISVVLDKLSDDEKNDEIALKFMSIVDYELERKNLYTRIRSTNLPKMLQELLGFKSYKSFAYYEYINNSKLDGKNVQCPYCQLFGPYASMLTHLAINHNISIGYKICFYCHHWELKDHFDSESSLQICYENYLQQHEISDIVRDSFAVHQIIKDFYSVIKQLSVSLGVVTQRQIHRYAGKGLGKPEEINVEHGDDLSSTTTAYKQKAPRKIISTIPKNKLNKMFVVAITAMCGGEALFKFMEESSSIDLTDPEMPSNCDNPRPSTSNASARNERTLSTNTTTHEHPLSEFTNRTNTPGFDDPFIAYLSSRIQSISDADTRRNLEDRLQADVREAEHNQPQRNQ
ncbi:uncharacterized protein LOC129566057 [Sitodiplosis mosellana]|uniref:uncharacterized protein LOC129566057 n=1 Tax=Sitodiplosis mosellana TaxID=263140 RepID=UPI0024452DE9|nr:uncharacterized protein LOC129566057 [Sitodiplosis mosellana]